MDRHLISVDELREAGALDVPPAWRKSLCDERPSGLIPGLFDDEPPSAEQHSPENNTDEESTGDDDSEQL